MGKKKTLRSQPKKQRKKKERKSRYVMSSVIDMGDFTVKFNKEELLYKLNVVTSEISDKLLDRILEMYDFYDKILDKYLDKYCKENTEPYVYSWRDATYCKITNSQFFEYYLEPIVNKYQDFSGKYLNALYEIQGDRVPNVKDLVLIILRDKEPDNMEWVSCDLDTLNGSAPQANIRFNIKGINKGFQLLALTTDENKEETVHGTKHEIGCLVRDMVTVTASVLGLGIETEILDDLELPEIILEQGKHLNFNRDISYYGEFGEIVAMAVTTCGIPRKVINRLLYDKLFERNKEIIDSITASIEDKVWSTQLMISKALDKTLPSEMLTAEEVERDGVKCLEFVESQADDLDTVTITDDVDKTVKQYIDSYKELSTLAEQGGFVHERDKGDHGIFKNKDGLTVIIPQGRTIGKGLSIAIQKAITGEKPAWDNIR